MKETLETRYLVLSDVLDITVPNLWFSEAGILLNDGINRPSREMTNDCDSTTSSMLCGWLALLLERIRDLTCLAMIAMNEKRIIALVKDYLHYGIHNNFWYVDLLGTLHLDDAMTDTVVAHEFSELHEEVLVHKGAGSNQQLLSRNNTSNSQDSL